MNRDYCVPRRFYEGDDLYDTLWTRISGIYNEQLEKVGMKPGSHVPLWIEVDMEVIDGEEKPWPLTTHDETLYGDGLLADGTPIGSPEAIKRSDANMKHVVGIVAKKHSNVTWNWTKGRAFEEGDGPPDVIHKVGENPKFPAFRADRTRCRWPMPTDELKKRLEREKKSGGGSPDIFERVIRERGDA